MTDPRCDEHAEDPGDAGSVIPFPADGRMDRARQREWSFGSEVHRVGGTEGEWLAGELAGVVRALLLWADGDLRNHAEERDEEQAA